jgi:hypothetical protein
MPISGLMIIIDNFNIDKFDQNLTQPNELQSFIDQYSMKIQLKFFITNYESHIDFHMEKCTHSTMHVKNC